MKNCRVSVVSPDGETHTITVRANSLFDAARQAQERWSMLWWHQPDAVLEVCAGVQRWKVRGDRIRRWNAARAVSHLE